MTTKGAYPKLFSKSAAVALEKFIDRRARELGFDPEHIPGGGRTIGGWLGISQGQVSKLQSGRGQVQMNTALRLAEELGVTLNDVMYHAGSAISGTVQPATPRGESHITETPRSRRKGKP